MANLYIFMDMRSPRKDGSGTLKLALTHKHKTVYESLGIRIKKEEWDPEKMAVITRPDKKFHNIMLRKRYAEAQLAFQRIQQRADFESLTARDILTMVVRGTDTADSPASTDYLLPVFNECITLCRKANTAVAYKSALRTLKEYETNIDTLRFADVNVAWLRKYQQWMLEEKELSVNGAIVYLRCLRAVFNYAIQNEMTAAKYPFKGVDMNSTEPDKRTIEYDKFLEWASCPVTDGRARYRDIFMLSFFLCGIRPIDLFNAKWSQVEDGRLVYCPEKLGGKTKLSIKIEPEAWEIINRYRGEEYLLDMAETKSTYNSFSVSWNKALKAIGKDEREDRVGKRGRTYYIVKHHGIVPYISAYYARTCWATYSYNIINTPMDIISQALGHKSGLRVTNFYVKRDVKKVDEANRALIDRVTKDIAEYKKKNKTRT